jgi:FMN phosphatase YigB (HAD superfamily)
MTDTAPSGADGVCRFALFDLDNTLIDRQEAFRLWMTRFLTARGIDEREMAWVIEADEEGMAPRLDFFAAINERFGLEEDAEALTSAYGEDTEAMYSPQRDVLEPLASLRAAGWKTVVVTNGPPSQEAKIRAAALHDAVDAWCISGIVGAAKPERAIFEAAAALCGASLDAPFHGWMVGDNPDTDILGAARAGLRTIWMARGRAWARADFAPDAVAADVAEAAGIILAG